MTSMGLAGQTALITGGAKRLGRAVALGLAREGVNVVIHYRQSANEAEALVDEIKSEGVGAWGISADLEHPTEAADLFARAETSAGAIDILINNASIFPSDRLTEVTGESITSNVRVNALAPLLLSRSMARLGRTGSIVNFLDARIGDYDSSHVSYHLSKRMLFSLTRMMAVEFAPSLRVNAVAPGLVLPPEGNDVSYLEGLSSSNPLRTYGSPADVVATVLFLLSNRFITGQVIYVDGGRHMLGGVYG